ncbi:MAG: alanine--tRNA ligase, partial [Muribaculaceae bacterium]|nr:alanine--tRNA ligase [Muribaculaceae bacterium]
ILRRAVRYGYTFLDQKQAFMYRLVDTLIESMGEAYPELGLQRELIIRVIKEEEDAFLRTLENGIRLLDASIAEAKKNGKAEISGKEAFILYDTYGFPLDLTELILKENGMTLDHAEFDTEMAAQKARARNAAATETSDWVVVNEGEQEFVGYDKTSVATRILRYRQVKQKNNTFYQIILSATPFYAEMGGQVGDTGTLTAGEDVVKIVDTKRENGIGVHIAKNLPADVEAEFVAAINEKDRLATSCNHTATHLLHEALREVLGTHVEQKGSLVSPDSLRFDFSHFQKLTSEEIRRVEHLANTRVRQAIPLDEHRSIPIAKAREMGAMALFGEKYGEEVRVIRYGSSIELCGGTHVPNTGNIGMIRIVSESSIAAGIRRIEAITGEAVEDAMDKTEDTVRAIGMLFNNAPNLMQAVRNAIDENADLRKKTDEFMKEKIESTARNLLEKAEEVNGVKVVEVRGLRNADVIKNTAFAVRQLSPSNTVFVAATHDAGGKPLLTVMLSEEVVAAGNNAGQIVREAAKLIQGGGGGQPGFAQAGGKNADGLMQALARIRELLVL